MKYLKLFENFLDEYTQDRKILIVIGSVNSRGVNSKSSEEVKIDAEKNWQILLEDVTDLTGLIEIMKTMFNSVRDREKKANLLRILDDVDNIGFAKLIFGLVDKIKFYGKADGGFASEIVKNLPKTKLDELLRKIRDILLIGVDRSFNLTSQYRGDFDFLKQFQSLDINQKLTFLEIMKNDPNYLVIRDSYIYVVVDESNLIEVCDRLLLAMDESKYNN